MNLNQKTFYKVEFQQSSKRSSAFPKENGQTQHYLFSEYEITGERKARGTIDFFEAQETPEETRSSTSHYSIIEIG